MESNNSNFNSISPSAMALFETKSLTSIPFAKESYTIVSSREKKRSSEDIFSLSNFNTKDLPKKVISRIKHFEARYLSIDKGLKEVGTTKILEFSSGLSFRGLDLCKNQNIHYVDTDLPNIIETKKKLLAELIERYCDYQPTNLILRSMNALNEEEFFDAVSIFTSGPISLVNEGLLIYLNLQQKEHLCNIIHKILTKYGGYWITTDIYINEEEKSFEKFYKQKDVEFREKHNIDNNKFTSFKEAKDFFSRSGFEIYKKIKVEEQELSSSKLTSKEHTSKEPIPIEMEKERETWILRPT